MGQPRGRPLLLLLWAVLGGASGLKVLSFGDSLTAGRHNCTTLEDGSLASCAYRPYTLSTRAWFKEFGPALEEQVELMSLGICGLTARGMLEHFDDARRVVEGEVFGVEGFDVFALDAWPRQMRFGLGATLEAYAALGDRVDTVVLLAGTEDLLEDASASAEAVADAVWRVHERVHATGTRTIALEIPRCVGACGARPDFEARRVVVNRILRERVMAARLDGVGRAGHYDSFPSNAMLNMDDGSLFDADGRHLTAMGYRGWAQSLSHLILETARLWRCDDQGRKSMRHWPTSKAPISVGVHSFRLIFGRAIISRSGLAA